MYFAKMRDCEEYAVHINRIQTLALQRRIHKGEFTGRELSSNPARGRIYTREARKRRRGSERVESLSAAIHQSVESIRWN